MPFIGQSVSNPQWAQGDSIGSGVADLPARISVIHDHMSHTRKQTLDLAQRTWFNSGGRWNPRAVNSLATTVNAAQITTSALQSAFMQAAADVQGYATPVTDEITERPGVTKDSEYSRPFNEVEWALGLGVSEEKALQRGLLRLKQLVTSDLQLAKTKTARDMLQHSEVQRYRRVIGSDHPCPLCLLASTQTYYTEDLMPIHPSCECDVEPMPEGFDPRSIFIPHEYLVGPTTMEGESTRTSGGGPTAASVRAYLQSIARQYGSDTPDLIGPIPTLDDLIQVRQHGELGPVLTFRGQAFRGPDDLPRKPSSRIPRQVTPRVKMGTYVVDLDALSATIEDKLAAAAETARSINEWAPK